MAFVIVALIIGIPAGIGVWLTERVDRPRRRALREAHIQPAE